MYLYDIDENTCINLGRIERMRFDPMTASIYFYNYGENAVQVKRFTKEEEARKEYDRIKAMINDPPMIMSLDNGQLNNFMKKKGRH